MAQSPQSPDPLALVGRAEQLCAAPDKVDKEDAILLLWDALEQLCARADQPAAAGLSTALALLQANDPLHGDRLAAGTAVARVHADLALLYRGKKWLATEYAATAPSTASPVPWLAVATRSGSR